MSLRRTTAVAAVTTVLTAVLAAVATGVAVPPARSAVLPAEVRVAAGRSVPVDVAGQIWSADVHHVGGLVVASPRPVTGTEAPLLYAAAREGMSGYVVPLPDGTYTVTLSMVETLHRSTGRRVFDVSAEGTRVLTRVDVLREAGGRDRALERTFRTTVRDGRLDITYRALRDRPVLSAIRVSPDVTSPSPSPAPVWADEFDGPAGALPDPARWGYEWGGLGWGDGELQEYTDRRAENASTDGQGHLRITARREQLDNPWSGGARYTSARLTTASTYSFRYGRVETRAKVPAGQGLWPAFWLLGADTATLGWPAGGEMDVMETIGEATTVEAHLHGATTTGQLWSEGRTAPAARFAEDFHVYGMEWREDVVSFSVDGRTYGTVRRADLPPGATWPFDRPHHMLLNVAVGGSWPGPPDSTTPFPATMLVDWVRVYG